MSRGGDEAPFVTVFITPPSSHPSSPTSLSSFSNDLLSFPSKVFTMYSHFGRGTAAKATPPPPLPFCASFPFSWADDEPSPDQHAKEMANRVARANRR